MKQIKPRDKAFLIEMKGKEDFPYILVSFASTEERAKMKALDIFNGEIILVKQVRFVI